MSLGVCELLVTIVYYNLNHPSSFDDVQCNLWNRFSTVYYVLMCCVCVQARCCTLRTTI